MDPVVVVFLVIGAFALLLLLLSLIGGHTPAGHLHLGHLDLGHLHLGHVDLGHMFGHPHAGEGGAQMTLPAIAGFVGAFGFGGAIVAALWPGHGSGTVLLASAAGLVAAVPTAWAAGRLVAAAMTMPTDATPTSADLLGAMGVVVSAVPAGGYGEVRLLVAGQQVRYHARADTPLPEGTAVFVVDVPSPTSVLVEATPSIR